MNGRVAAETAGVVLAATFGSLAIVGSNGLSAGGATVSSLAKDWRRRGMKRSATSDRRQGLSAVGQLAKSAMSLYASTNQKPRSSGIPTPGRPNTGIPTPGRLRSVSSAGSATQSSSVTPVDDTTYISRTLADAIKANDPAQHRTSTSSQNSSTLSPSSSSYNYSSGKSISANRPSSVASSVSAVSSANGRASSAQNHSAPARSVSRQSNVHGRSVSRTGRQFEIGDDVRIESLGFEGVLRFAGPIEGKPGEWAGVELGGGFVGKGKNDGSVNG